MHVRVISPVITKEWEEGTWSSYAMAARQGTQVSVVSLDWGTASIESYRDEALVVPDILAKVVLAERTGVDAVIINCMADPGLYAARELVRIPVVGPAEASMHLAAMLGHRFSVLALLDSDVPNIEDQAARYGLSTRLASVRPIHCLVLELHKDIDAVVPVLIESGERAVQEDGAHVLIPGCTGLAGLSPRIQAGLAKRGCEVPVLDPPAVAMKLAESLVELHCTHSRRTYCYPPSKEIRWPVPGAFGT